MENPMARMYREMVEDLEKLSGKWMTDFQDEMSKWTQDLLRDAFAVMAVQADDSTDGVRMLQAQLGHQSIGTTMKYRKVAGKEQREWYDKLKERTSNGNNT